MCHNELKNKLKEMTITNYTYRKIELLTSGDTTIFIRRGLVVPVGDKLREAWEDAHAEFPKASSNKWQ